MELISISIFFVKESLGQVDSAQPNTLLFIFMV